MSLARGVVPPQNPSSRRAPPSLASAMIAQLRFASRRSAFSCILLRSFATLLLYRAGGKHLQSRDAIKQEEALASVDHSIAEVDKEQAHLREHEIRSKVKAAKKRYEDSLRRKFYGF